MGIAGGGGGFLGDGQKGGASYLDGLAGGAAFEAGGGAGGFGGGGGGSAIGGGGGGGYSGGGGGGYVQGFGGGFGGGGGSYVSSAALFQSFGQSANAGNGLVTIDAVPEPSSWALMMVGVALFGARLRQGRRALSGARPSEAPRPRRPGPSGRYRGCSPRNPCGKLPRWSDRMRRSAGDSCGPT